LTTAELFSDARDNAATTGFVLSDCDLTGKGVVPRVLAAAEDHDPRRSAFRVALSGDDLAVGVAGVDADGAVCTGDGNRPPVLASCCLAARRA